MEKKWQAEVARIRDATKLTIELLSCARDEWPQARRQYEQAGGEIVRTYRKTDRVWYVGIPRDEWPAQARALLSLLLSPTETDESGQEAWQAWLRTCLFGETGETAVPTELPWQWKEPRGCFLLERTHADTPADLTFWQELLHDFFAGKPLTALVPLDNRYLLLLVPLSLFSDLDSCGPADRQLWLDWAAGLHELLSSEAGETVRVMTTLPVSIPRQLGAAMQRFAGLRQALQQYLPQVMIAATWQHALEQWAASLSPDTAKALAASLKPHVGAERLSADQIEIVETFCAHNLNVSETARALFLHRNTLLYRLDKLTEQTGLDIRNAADALLLRLALLFRQND